MATGMKFWGLLTGVGVAVVSLSLLPPSPPRWADWSVALPHTHEEKRADALDREVTTLRLLLQRRSWADSLSALALASAVDGVAVGAPDMVPSEDMAAFRARVSGEARALGGVRDDVVVGAFVQPRDRGRSHPSIQGDQRMTQEWYLGRRDGITYCLSLVVVHPRDAALAVSSGNSPLRNERSTTLGPCHLVARYGMPSPTIERWLEAGAFDYGRAPATFQGTADLGEFRKARTLFGLKLDWMGNGDRLAVDQCRAGMPEGCAALFLEPRLESRQTAAAELAASTELLAAAPTYFSALYLLDDWILADLAEEFGPDAFQRFWTSDRPVEESFRAAFGTDPGSWLAGWVRGEMELYEPGPAVGRASLPGTMLLLSLFGGIAALWARRRSVG